MFNKMKMLTFFVKNNFKPLGFHLFLFYLVLGIETNGEDRDEKSQKMGFYLHPCKSFFNTNSEFFSVILFPQKNPFCSS